MSSLRRINLAFLLCLSTVYLHASDYLDEDLREEVNALIDAVEASPSTVENARERAAVLWRWTNQWSLAERFVPVNLTQVIASILGFDAPSGVAVRRRMDDYIKQLAFIDEDPERLGKLEAEGDPFIVVSHDTLTQTYSVGTADVQTGGGFLVGRHFMAGYSLQTDNPGAANFIAIESTNDAVEFEVDSVPLSGMHGGFRGATGALMFRLSKGQLTRGDQVTLTYGDTTAGGPGLRMPDMGSDFMVFPLYVAFDADDLFIALPIQPITILGEKTEGVHGFAPSIVKQGEPLSISVRARDRFFNRPTGPIPGWRVKLNAEVVGETAPSQSVITQIELAEGLNEPGVYQLTIESLDGSIQGYGNAILVEAEPDRYIYWGDTHGHSGFAEGLGSPDRFMQWAKEDAALDYVTHSEHDIWMDDYEWQVLIDNVEQYSDANFIAFLGYEWTRNKFLGGHHNVIFRDTEGRERVPAQLYGTLAQLFRGIHDHHDPMDVVVIPHAHQPGNYRFTDPDLVQLVEIMSQHGSFEWYGQKYLQHGHEVGFTAASDNHLSQPGYTAPKAGGLSQRGGLGALIATEKTRDSLFNAMKNINAYATTGDRIILDFNLNGTTMGKRIPYTADRAIAGRVVAAWPVSEIAVIKNDTTLWSQDYLTNAESTSVTEGTFKVSFGSASHPHHEYDNPRGWKHWAGTLSIKGATIVAAEAMDFSNTQSQNLHQTSDHDVAFSTHTRGDESSFDLTLTNIQDDTLLTFELTAGREYGGGPPTFREHQPFSAHSVSMALQGPLGETSTTELSMADYTDYIRVRRIVTDGPRDVSFSVQDTSDKQGDYYYVRATLANDAVAWSSPIWVGGYKTR